MSYDITWVPLDQVASGLGTPNISLVDITGDRRADYMIWDQRGGLTGYLNVRGAKETPVWLDQGPDKSIAQGVGGVSSLPCSLTSVAFHLLTNNRVARIGLSVSLQTSMEIPKQIMPSSMSKRGAWTYIGTMERRERVSLEMGSGLLTW